MPRLVRIAGMLLTDALLINLSYIIAFLLRFDFALKAADAEALFAVYGKWWILLTVIKLAVFAAVGMYSSLWRYAGGGEYLRVTGGILLGNLAAAVFLWIVGGRFPIGLLILILLLDLLLIAAARGFHYYFANYRGRGVVRTVEAEGGRKTMIVGANSTARDLIREMRMRRGRTVYTPTVLVGGGGDVTGTRLEGLKVSGTRKDIAKLARRSRISDIFITIPAGEIEELEAVRRECAKTSCKVWEVPGLYEVLDGYVETGRRSVTLEEVDEMIGGQPVYVNRRQMDAGFGGRIVMVTEGASVPGREFCVQAAGYGAKTIVALGTSEQELEDLAEYMKETCPGTGFAAALASVSDPERIREVFEKYKPHIVLHNAFYGTPFAAKENLKEMISRNVFGTANVLRACEAAAAERFIMISSDRADDRKDPRGASLRAAEILVQKARSPKVLYSCVRMGRTVYDADSGVREMIREIETGGPVRLAREGESRTFSPMKDSVKLALQAAVMARGGEIFAMETGRRIDMEKLAEQIISAYGLRPHEQIRIEAGSAEPGAPEPVKAVEDRARERSNSFLVILEEELTEESPGVEGYEALKEALDRESEEAVLERLQELMDSFLS